MKKRPNFFIVGAPKCGTTALYHYLREHPNVFMPIRKEPHFFMNDFSEKCGYIREADEYGKLFEEASSQEVALGEASVFYLSSETALSKIQAFDPEAKIIVMLRKPVEMIPSYYAQMRYIMEEDQKALESAWNLQEDRRQGRNIPSTCLEAKRLQYHRIGKLGTQVKRLLQIFPRKQVKIILFDDFCASTGTVYEEVVAFLGVPSDHRKNFPIFNERKFFRNALMHRLFWRHPLFLRKIIRRMHALPLLHHVRFHRLFGFLNIKKSKKPRLSSEFRQKLIETFRGEVEILSKILERNLDPWNV